MKIGIYGAGSIGCYLGGCLASQGVDVLFLCRARIYATLQKNGLRLTDFHGREDYIAAEQLKLTLNPEDLLGLDIIFICVKSDATEQVAEELKALSISDQTILISFQNGVSNVPILKSVLPKLQILEGMVPFNVSMQGEEHFHQGTEGALYVKSFKHEAWLNTQFEHAHLPIEFSTDMLGVQWAKILLNLNNAVNALSGQPLQKQLSNRAYRQCLAMAQKETLQLLTLAKIKPAQLTAVPAGMIPLILNLPNVIFKIISRKMLAIDPLARSSMQDDLSAGKHTEIDWINGEVIRLAEQLGQTAPINLKLVNLIKNAEQQENYTPMSSQDLKRHLLASE